LVEALVRAVVVEVAHVLVEDGEGVSFVVDQQPIGALLANTADESLGVAVRLRCLGRDLDVSIHGSSCDVTPLWVWAARDCL
jgi:hypothetical protein